MRHEQIHVNRGDLWWNLLAQCMVALFWFNPLVWLAYQHFRQAQELACDETVIGGAPASLKVEYANALLCTSTSKEISPHLIHYGDKSILKNRLNRVMNQVHSKRWKNVIAVIMLSLVTLSATLAAAGNYDSPGVSGVPLKRFEPVYPPEAAKQGIEGSVTLMFDIETDGSVSNVSITEARPDKIFDKSAKTALRKWLYEKPQTRLEGVLVQLDFVLSEEGSQLSNQNHDNNNELVLVENHN